MIEPALGAFLVLVLTAGTWAQQPAENASRPPAEDTVAQVLTLLEQGRPDEARELTARRAARLAAELTAFLDEVDKDFDDMSRQKARSDVLEQRFDRLLNGLHRHQQVFELYGRTTGDQQAVRRLQAKTLRVEGAWHTTRADALWDRVEYDAANKEYAAAIVKLREALPLARRVEDQKLIGSCLNNIAYAQVYLGNETEGVRNYTEALKTAEQRGDEVYRALYNLNLATFHLYTGHSDVSLRYSLEAGELSRRTGRKTWEANALLNTGSAHLLLGHTSEAQRALEKALEKSDEANDARSHGRILFNLAFANAQSGRHADAAARMEDALRWYARSDVYGEAERTLVRYNGLSFLAGTYRRLNQPERAKMSEDEILRLRERDPQKLAAYLADPHLTFARWPGFQAAHANVTPSPVR
jgi:tetratricopeptide (TPR) repeat protein